MLRLPDVRGAGWILAAGAAVAIYSLAFAWGLANTSYDFWAAFLIAPVLLVISLPLISFATRNEIDSVVVAILVAGLVLKLFAALPRYWMAYVLYGGGADSAMYSDEGAILADHFRQFDFDVDLGRRVMGTGFLIIVTGVVFALIGPTTLGGFVFFAWLGYWGLFFFYKAFRVAMPDADLRRYSVLLFLMPSLLFWPSSIGKDTWMLLALGLFSYGAALLLERRKGAFVFLTLGVLGTVFLRPHVTLVAAAALAVAMAFRRSPDKLSALGPLRSILTIGALGLGLMIVLAKLSAFLGRDSLELGASLEQANTMTNDGGSSFDSAPASSPAQLPWAIITVLFRPFPFEAHNIQALITSAEGTVLLLLVILGAKRFKGFFGYVRQRPYVAYCTVYILLFCYVFASFQNFGILARERVQVFPLVVALLAIPLVKPESQRQQTLPVPKRSVSR